MSERAPYSVLAVSEIDPVPVAGVLWKPLRQPLGIDAFGINAYSAAAAGDHVIESHSEESLGHQEVYVVIAGHAMFTIDGVDLDAPNGTVVFVRDPSVSRGATAVDPDTTVLAIGGVPGTHLPSAWEWFFGAERFRASGNHAAALDLLAEGLERFPENPGILYSIACWEAMAGNTDSAIAALSSALELDPKTIDWARNDTDLDAIRGLPGSPV